MKMSSNFAPRKSAINANARESERWPVFVRLTIAAAIIGPAGLLTYQFGQHFVDRSTHPELHRMVPILGLNDKYSSPSVSSAKTPSAAATRMKLSSGSWSGCSPV